MTLGQIKTLVENDLDLQDEDFIDSDEFTGYIQEAVRECEAEIHKLNLEDNYFLSKMDLTLVLGSGDLTLPTDIYATKLKAIEYDYSDRAYEITRFQGSKKFQDFLYFRRYGTATSFYKYLLTNTAADGPMIQIAPVAQESGVRGTIWYIRNAAVLTDEDDECDIPEFVNFIIQFARDKCINKERMTPDAPPSAALQAQRALMIATLTEQVPDGQSGAIEKDYSHYEDSI